METLESATGSVMQALLDDVEQDFNSPDKQGELDYAKWCIELMESSVQQVKNLIASSGTDGRYKDLGKYKLNPHCTYKPRDKLRVRVVELATQHINRHGPSSLKSINDMCIRHGISVVPDHGSPAFWLTRGERRVIISQ